jgi:hypothetical protein
MKNLLQKWNFRQVIYLIGGIFFILIAIKDKTWWMIPFGLYFASMAIFRFGCASGNCEIQDEKEDANFQN